MNYFLSDKAKKKEHKYNVIKRRGLKYPCVFTVCWCLTPSALPHHRGGGQAPKNIFAKYVAE
jgi:hypothetical protein